MGYIGGWWGKFRKNRLYIVSRGVNSKIHKEHKFPLNGGVINGEFPQSIFYPKEFTNR